MRITLLQNVETHVFDFQVLQVKLTVQCAPQVDYHASDYLYFLSPLLIVVIKLLVRIALLLFVSIVHCATRLKRFKGRRSPRKKV